MSFKISSRIEYTSWLIKKHIELQENMDRNIYRIIELKQIGDSYKLIIQVVGELSIIELSPLEIVHNDLLLTGFSQKDVRTITCLACEQNKHPKYKIILQEFCEKFNKMKFKLKEHNVDKFIMKTANEILTDESIIENLSKRDINCISYIGGYECSQQQTMFLDSKDKQKM